MVSKEQRFINRLSKQQPMMVTPIATNMVLPNHSGTKKDPVLDGEIATKKYVDDNAGGGAPEGTAVKSTGESGGTKFLREDGDGTCSWQDPPTGHDAVTLAASATDGGLSLSTQEIGFRAATNAQSGYATAAHIAAIEANTAKISYTDAAKVAGIEAGADVTDTANVTAAGALMDSEVDADIKTLSLPANTTISTFGASLVDDADASAGRSTLGLGDFAVLNTTTDHSSADTAYVPLVLYNTDATPPTASTVPIGTIYIQYTP